MKSMQLKKRCCRCTRTKSVIEFMEKQRNQDGYESRCMACTREMQEEAVKRRRDQMLRPKGRPAAFDRPALTSVYPYLKTDILYTDWRS